MINVMLWDRCASRRIIQTSFNPNLANNIVKMAAVIRIKRHLNEDPLNAVLLNCKRRKTDDLDTKTGDLSAVLKFAGTVNNQEEDVFKHLKKPTKAETEEQYKKHSLDIIKKLREQRETSSKNNRYKVINSFRSNDSAIQQSTQSDSSCTIVDIETDENKEEVAKDTNNSNPKFVYDLYYTNSDDFGDADLNEFISVYPLSDCVIYDARNDGYNNESDTDDSEDSNAENNWKNDYPDESDVESPVEGDDESITEGDMLQAMKKVALHDDEDLSSDDYDEAFGYDREEDLDSNYSSFKTRMKKELNNDFCYYDEYDDSCTP